MKKIKLIYLTILIMLLSSACKKEEEKISVVQTGGGMIDIYYPEGYQVVKAKEQYQIKQPDSVSACVEEIMTQYVYLLDEGLVYHTYLIDTDNNVTLQFVSEFEGEKEYELLAKAAITETMFQIDDIKSVSIVISNLSGDVISSDLYLRDSFYFYDYQDTSLNSEEVKIYYPDSTGKLLLSEKKDIRANANITMVEAIVMELAAMEAIPVDTKVNDVYIYGDMCYLDLNADFENDLSGVKSDVVVYAVVNSITSLSHIEKVQITIDGERIEMYRENVNIYSPLNFNTDILK